MVKLNTNQQKINSLQFVRALAFLEIFSCHILWGSGALGVSIFFILSGFLLSYNYVNFGEEHGDLKNNLIYAYGKIRTLYPLHIIMMLYAILIAIVQNDIDLGNLIRNILAHLFLIQTWIPDRNMFFSLNGVSWYLSTALFTYFCFPYILRRIKDYKNYVSAMISILMVVVIQLFMCLICYFLSAGEEAVYYLTYVCPLYRIGDFIIGCNLGYLFLNRRKGDDNSGAMATIIEFMILAVLVLFEILYMEEYIPLYFKYQIFFLPVSVAFVWIFAISNGKISQILSNKLVFLLHQ